jgi:hypothetical protein
MVVWREKLGTGCRYLAYGSHTQLSYVRAVSLGALPGADDLEVLVDEDVVRPVDADVVDLVLAVAQ